jgi:hypothetical protein
MNGQATTKRAGASRPHRRDGADAFVPDPSEAHEPAPDDLAEALGESYVSAATSGEHESDHTLDGFVLEELGGPFVQDGEVDPLPDGFARVPPALRPELRQEPEVLGFEPHPVKPASGNGKRVKRAKKARRPQA